YHHTVRAGQYDEAMDLFYNRINKATYYQFGAYQLRIELLSALFPDGDPSTPSAGPALPRLKDESAQAWTLNSLANSYSLSGQPRRAVPLFEQAIAIDEKRGDKQSVAIDLGNVALDQIRAGALRAAEANLRRRIALCREIEDEFQEAVGHQELGRLLAYRGAFAQSEEHLAIAWQRWKADNDYGGMGQIQAYRCIAALLNAQWEQARIVAIQALELAMKGHYGTQVVERDIILAHWLLGAAHRADGDYAEAERHLAESLARCRGINMVDHEADILIDLARLRVATAEPEEAARLADEALEIAERCGYVLQGADAHLELAKLALVGAGSRPPAREAA
ncbi:MAG: tetratricopeptide repeat protein, partial [Anaerolineales bacterium]